MRGGLLINKPVGISSFDVIRRLRELLPRSTKMGHSGTLDPAAHGLLLILVGQATRIQHLLKDLDKEYIAHVRLGVATDTLDSEGEVVEEVDVPDLDEEKIREALSSLTGTRMQRPPQYSAVKVRGRRAFELAREGREFELREREVKVYELELLSWERPIVKIRAGVSRGTYIRSLAAEIGSALSLPASLSSLVRTRVGRFRLENSSLLDNLTVDAINRAMIPIEELLGHLPQVEVDDLSAHRLLEGKPLNAGFDPGLAEEPYCVVFSPGHERVFLCEPRKGMLWSRRMIYKEESKDA
ncbi:tRNA pseudouridine(55) synthase TruB [candidate division WOR-3 bacterium]|nr:tRNA pseudouridine(55) synthase TruB [candidate division WOR-3 bacterium]